MIDRLERVGGLLGSILKWFALIFLVPLSVAIFQGTALLPFVVAGIASCLMGILLEYSFPRSELEVADGFLLVFLAWVMVSVVGSLPYIVMGTGSVAEPINALFESISGYTCTGSTVMAEISIDKYSHALMLYRQLTQWLGGMGIVVLAVAVLPRLSIGGVQFLDNEMPGPRIEKLSTHMATTARRLWLLYIGATAFLFVLLLGGHWLGWAPRMNAFQAFSHVFTTLPSGGFSPEARSVEAFSPYVQWVLIPFMLVAAMNFVLLFRSLISGPRELAKDTEFRVYFGLFLGIGSIIALMLFVRGFYDGLEESFRHGLFQTTTFLTSTGYASADFTEWSGEITVFFVLLSFSCGCAGSTSGSLKILRWIIGTKFVYRDLFSRIHPSAVGLLRMGKRVLKSDVVRGAASLILAYLGLFAVSVGLVAIDVHLAGLDASGTDLVTSVAVTLGNIGPGLGKVGPMENFLWLPEFSRLWLGFLMIAGRLEVMTVMVLIVPAYWNK